ncbi:hypothetical protein HETIRDRAFT_115404 [Heterobasidion irregulare TC 32-1]|uniref:Uncharacterized protein n=1 Tax=Heterobasidion irregulare (strain TC 32-1) TaxID=747525 RepID=W4KHJ2_HETIT|nr:uncharacterized protein HETIRDRAFT_115404 [Heterobasidion irregulare TC 32-1]ETW85189.1 hypothetical protein HETIRDRAFT_115404 [Heterobasidion irregulare TC 32-1]
MYQGLAAYRVICWDPSEVICCIGEDLFVPDEYQHMINWHLLHLFKDKYLKVSNFLIGSNILKYYWAVEKTVILACHTYTLVPTLYLTSGYLENPSLLLDLDYS